jgi:hypothetical protein
MRDGKDGRKVATAYFGARERYLSAYEQPQPFLQRFMIAE